MVDPREIRREYVRLFALAFPERIRAAKKRYDTSEKGRAAKKRYDTSEKGRAADKRYAASEKGRASKKRYHASEKGRASKKRHRASEKGRAAHKRYDASEKGRTAHKRYRASEKGRASKRLRDANRRARKRDAVVEGWEETWNEIDSDTVPLACIWCGILTTRAERHIEHCEPLARGGKHSADNLAPACINCNCRKGDKLLDEWIAELTAS